MELTFEISTVADFADQSASKSPSKRRASDSLRGPDGVKKPRLNRGGRPRTKTIPSSKPTKAPTKLRQDRPVMARIPIDVWQTILGFCKPAFLLKARLVSTSFNAALSLDSAWRTARFRMWGLDHPDPPTGISEMQYADLLTGVGCQTRGCKGKPRRTYWAFQRRWCEPCLAENVVTEKSVICTMLPYQLASQCIPQAKYDTWGHYQWVGHYDETPVWSRMYFHQGIRYSKAAVERLSDEIHRFTATKPEDKDEIAWFQDKRLENEEFVRQLQAVEGWVETFRLQKIDQATSTRAKRATWYQEQARLLDSPLEPDVLARCPSYIRAVNISRIPTLRSWSQLRPKIEAERAVALEQIIERRRREAYRIYRDQLVRNRPQTIIRRANKDSPEQSFVLSLADEVIRELNNSESRIADSDLVNLILRRVFKAYQDTDDALKPVGQHGTHRLIMDDARMVYNDKIKPFFASWEDAARLDAAIALKCPGCLDQMPPYSFEDLMKHQYDRHRYQICFRYLLVELSSSEYPWYCLEWPKNLPMLATHQSSFGHWDVDDDTEYQCAEPEPLDETSPTPEDHRPSTVPISGAKFCASITYAMKAVRNINVDNRYKSKMILEFARKRQAILFQRGTTSAEEIEHMKVVLKWGGQGKLFDNHCCLRCQQTESPSEFAGEPHSFKDLAAHYLSTHGTPDLWAHDMIAFPTNAQLMKALVECHDPKALQIYHGLFESINTNSRS